MIVLGVGDGLDAGASVVIDHRIVAVEYESRFDGQPRSRAFPWRAIASALGAAGVTPAEVDLVAVAGRFSPPLFVRRAPALRRLGRDPFSSALDINVFLQAAFRVTGWGAYDADLASEWLDGRFREHGFAPRRTLMVDVHSALAEAAYRCQPHDRTTVLVMHPLGDGTAFSVHVGGAGQLDTLWEQRGFATLHVHLQRCIGALGLRPDVDVDRLWALSARAEPDPDLQVLLRQHLRAEGPRLSRLGPPRRGRRTDPVYAALAEAPLDVAAASIRANLHDTVIALVRHHLAKHGGEHVALAGSIFDDPRLCADIAALDEVGTLSVMPRPGAALLPTGAAVVGAGIAPHTPDLLLGEEMDPDESVAALRRGGLQHHKGGGLVDVLAQGGAVGRARGRASIAREGAGTRSVLVRADDAAAVARVREALRLPPEYEPICALVRSPNESGIEGIEKLAHAERGAAVAPRVSRSFARRYPGVVTRDERILLHRVDEASDPSLHTVLTALLRQTGCAGVACFRLAVGDGPDSDVPAAAVDAWRVGRLEALQLGSSWILRDPA